MRKYIKLFLLLLLCFEYLFSYSQNAFDSSFTQAVSVYKKVIGINSHLYNGSEYADYDHRIKGNPFFESSYFSGGDIIYDGIYYTDVEMFYDILNDDVVIKNYNDTPMILVKEKISSFNFLDHTFININADSAAARAKAAGFYDVLYNGNTKLFAKRKKELVEKTNMQYSESAFVEKDNYYIFKNDALYTVRDKNSVLDVLKERKTDIEKFLHKSKIKYRKNPEAAMIKIVAYYDGLNNAK